MTKIYTRNGDDGKTSLDYGSGIRISKDSPEIHAYGNIDELNSILGLSRDLLVGSKCENICKHIFYIQNLLFVIGTQLSITRPHNGRVISENDIEYLEKLCDKLDEDLPPLNDFILPGYPAQSSIFHIARSVCRRAERSLCSMSEDYYKPHYFLLIKFLNRLSDVLFVISRWVQYKYLMKECIWDKEISEPSLDF